MSKTFNNTCPFCGSTDLESYGHIDSVEIANAQEYECNGVCGKTFHMQHFDENLIMKPTMNDLFLSFDSLAYKEKLKFERVAQEQEIDKDLPVCGNCVSYEWGTNLKLKFDRHCGSCSFQEDKINFTISDSIMKGTLHGLTNAKSCDNFYNFRGGVEHASKNKV